MYKDPKDPRLKASRDKWYYANKDKHRVVLARKKLELQQLLRQLKDNPCTDCGIRYPYYVMQWDHISGTKLYNPGSLVTYGSTRLLLEEIAKCELVCANCHAIRTHTRLTQE